MSQSKGVAQPGRPPGSLPETERMAREHGHVCTASRYTNHHELIPELVPFDYLETDPIETLIGLSEAIEEIPKTRAMFAARDIEEHLPGGAKAITTGFNVLLRILGAYKTDLRPNRHQVWVNPEYLHKEALDTITDTPARIRHCRAVSRVGAITGDDIAPRFGLTHGSFQVWCYRNRVPWREWQQNGFFRLGRTLRLVLEWTDYTEQDLYEALRIPDGSVRSCIQRYGRNGWDVPEDPSEKGWFRNKNVIRESSRRGDE